MNEDCRLLPNFEVEHWNCSDYQNGIVTKVSDGPDNGKIVAQLIDGKRVYDK